jgi:hypothetical protein
VTPAWFHWTPEWPQRREAERWRFYLVLSDEASVDGVRTQLAVLGPLFYVSNHGYATAAECALAVRLVQDSLVEPASQFTSETCREVTMMITLITLTLLLLTGYGAHASPIVLDSGTETFTGLVGSANLSGERLTLSAPGLFALDGLLGPFGCSPCRAGDPISLTANFSGSDFEGPATLDGVPYTMGLLFLPGSASALVDFSGSIIAPPITTGSVTLTAPVTLSGSFSPFGAGSESLTGVGFATVVLDQIAGPLGPLWQYDQVTYTLDAPTPTPEPATAGLLASAFATLAALRHLRRPR